MGISQVGLVILSYASGGVPSGYLLARSLRGIDIREHGSGNPGAANVYRVVGPPAGLATLALDAAKGFLPVLLARHLFPESPWLPALCGAAAVVGHDWSPFLGFGGGKGVATTAGVFLALWPRPLLASFAAFVAGVSLTGHISAGSMAGAAVFPLACLAVSAPAVDLALAFPASLLILYKHIPNLRSLMAGSGLTLQHRKDLEKNRFCL
ncbi:MAG: glycerol-3-phosphate 1-O-acyltransferase PlsY [Elusimicrobia bacterium]|nr:glycerol-3-phosphate 1-O-acyltransferase PlsY [Elusimicrobiota bacterium]